MRSREPLPIADALRRELYFFSLYRVFEAALLALVLFSPFGFLAGEPRLPVLGRGVSFLYLFAALVLYQWARRGQGLRWQVLVGTSIDIVAATLATHALPEAAAGIALLLLFNIGSAALLLPLRFGLGGALAFALDGVLRRRMLRIGPIAAPLAAILVLVPAGIEEFLQRYSINRTSSFGDFAADVVGVSFFVWLSRRLGR